MSGAETLRGLIAQFGNACAQEDYLTAFSDSKREADTLDREITRRLNRLDQLADCTPPAGRLRQAVRDTLDGRF